MRLARIYLRASTADQDAERARATLEAFAVDHDLPIIASYIETESGAKLDRPELRRLLRDARPGDILLVEQIDRLSRLSEADWRALRSEIEAKGLRIVALDLPTSHANANAANDEFTGRMLAAVNGMMLDMLAAVARKDYADRRRRQAEGIARTKASAPDRYAGRPENADRNSAIATALKAGLSWGRIQALTGCSRDTVARVARRIKFDANIRI